MPKSFINFRKVPQVFQGFDQGTALRGVFFFDENVTRSRLVETSQTEFDVEGNGCSEIQLPPSNKARADFVRKWMRENQKKIAAGFAGSLLFLPLMAEAQSVGFVAADTIEGVRSATALTDGSVRIVLESGQSMIVPAESVQILASGEIAIAQSAVVAISEVVSAGAVVAGGGAALAGGAGAAALGLAGLGGGGAAVAAAAVTVTAALNGFVVDGYVAGATVFRDVNNNGIFDAGEPNVLTDATGEFTGLLVDASNPTAKILTSGGIDISTGKPFLGTMSAPSDATVITPITTLVQALVESTAAGATPLTSAQAADQIATALGLPAGTDILSEDPVKSAEEGDLTALKASTQVANLLNLAAASGSGTSAQSSSAASQSLAESLVDPTNAPGDNPLTDAADLEAALTSAGSGDAADVAAAATSANTAIDNAADNQAGLAEIEKVQSVVQDTLVTDAAAGTSIGGTDIVAEAAKIVPLRPTLDRLPTSINAAEKAGGLDVSGTGRPATEITVDFGGSTKTATVASDGSWSVNFAGADFPTDPETGPSNVTATAKSSPTAPASPEANWSLVLDSTPPGAPTIDAVEGDDFINATEALGGYSVTGTSESGASIAVTIGGAVETVTADGAGAWSAHFTQAQLPADGAATVSAAATDTAGNPGSASASRSFTVDTSAPSAPTVGTIALDDIVNAVEKAAGVDITGTSGASETVLVTLGGTTKTVTADGTGAWTANFVSGDIPTDGSSIVSAVVQDTAGNSSAAATRTIEINTAPPGAPSFNAIATDDVVNATEKAAGVTVSGTVTVGSSVEVTLGGVVRAATVDGSGNWTVAFTSGEIPADGTASVSATATDASLNEATSTRSYIVDTTSLTPTISTIATDNQVDAAEAASGLVVSGSAEAGASVVVGLSGASRTTTTAADGSWTVLFAPGDIPSSGTAPITAFATDTAGNTSALGSQSVQFDTSAPGSPVVAIVAGDDNVNYLEGVAGVTISGTAEADAIITIALGQVSKTVTATSGTWSAEFTPSELPPDGVLNVSATATDSFGNEGIAGTRSLTFDARPPGVPSIDVVAGDDAINAAEKPGGVTVTGTAEGNVSVDVTIGTTTKTVTADGAGVWSASFIAVEIPSDGTTEVLAKATDSTGNISPVASRDVSVDTVAAAAPSISIVGSDDVINAVEKADGVDVTGTSEANASVAVTLGTTTHTVTADSAGAWSVTFTTAEIPADGSPSISATATDAAGNVGSAATRSISIDTAAPVVPVISAIATDDTVNSVEKAAGVDVSGTAEIGAAVAVTLDGTTRTATADGGGAWSVTFATAEIPADGNVSVSATATDAAGNASSAATRAIVVDTGLPNAPTISTVESDDIVNAVEAAAGVDVSGSADANASVTVTLGSAARTVTADGAGAWSASFASGDTPADGAVTVSAVVTDAVGNVSSAGIRSITVEARAPDAPVISTVAGDDVINAAEKAADVEVSGTAEIGASVAVTLGGIVQTVSADAAGAWTTTFLATNIPTDGAATISATATDAAGNTSTAGTRTISIDTSAPAAPVISAVATDDVIGTAEKAAGIDVSGSAEAGSSVAVTLGATTHTVTAVGGAWGATFAAGEIPADGSVSVSATSTDAAGNTGSAGMRPISIDTSAPAAPVISAVATDDVINTTEKAAGVDVSGTAEAGSSVAVTLGTTTQTVIAVGGTWSTNFASGDIPADADLTVSAIATNAAGNAGSAGTRSISIDTSAPAAPVISTVATDDVINTVEKAAGIDVSGTAEAGSSVAVTLGATTHTVTAVGGTWSATFAAGEIPADGSVSVSATATDAAGNTSAAGTRTISIDTSAPVAPVISLVAADDVIGTAEKAAGVDVSGTAEAGSSVAVTLGATTHTVTAVGGTWSATFAAGEIPADGSVSVSATSTDAAGNTGSAGTRPISIDTSAPAAPVISAVATDDVINTTEKAAGVDVSGTAEAGSSVAVTLGTTTQTVIAVGGTWSTNFASGDIPADADLTVSAIATNAAGNAGSAGTRSISIDTAVTAPTIGAVETDDKINGVEAEDGVVLSGTADTGDSVAVEFGGITKTVTATAGAWTASFARSEVPADGTVNVNAIATDPSGNVSSTTTRPVFVDATIDFVISQPVEQSDLGNLMFGTIFNPAANPSGTPDANGFALTATDPAGLPTGVYHVAVTGSGLTYDPTNGMPDAGTIFSITFSLDGDEVYRIEGANFAAADVSAAASLVLSSGGSDTSLFDALFAPYNMNLTGSSGNDGNIDGINGSSLSDVVNMGDGDDGFNGNGGDDVVDGGIGDDWFYAGSGNDTFTGGAGYDWFLGGAGDDTFNGGADSDMASYQNAATAVNIDLNNATQSDGDGGTDTLISVERLRGSAFDDTLTGDGNDNQFQGIAGADTIDGGAGTDEIRYDRDDRSGGTNGVTVDLEAGTATDGFGNVDTLSNIEDIRGSMHDDNLIGSSVDNAIRGEDGNDTLSGKGGNDTLRGGNGTDTFVYESGADVISDFTVNTDILDIRSLGLSTDQILAAFTGATDVTSPSGGGSAAMVTFSSGNTLTFDGLDAAAVQGLPQGQHGLLTVTIVMSTNDPIENLLNSTLVDENLAIDPSSITPTSVVANVAVSADFGGLPASIEFVGTGLGVDGSGNPTGTVTGFNFSVDGTLRASTSGFSISFLEMATAVEGLHDTPPSTTAFDALFSPYRMDWTGSPDMDLFHFPNSSDVSVRSNYGDVFTTGGGTGNGIYAGDGNDTIIATGIDDWAISGSGHDTFTGNATDNWFRGDAGNDVFDGQGGVDTASYSKATGSVHANLVTGIVIDGEGGVDRLTSVEAIRGGGFDDTFIGNSSDNIFRGLNGADSFDGGTGFDEVRYDRDGRQYGGHNSIQVDLAAGTAQDGFGATDTLTNIDSVVGSYTDDTLSGDGNDNSLNGDSGNDILAGRGGNDWYHGGAGYDVFGYSSGADKIDDFKLGVDRLDLSGLGISNALIQDAFDAAVTATSGADTGVLVDFGSGNTLFFNGLTQSEVRAMDPFVAFVQPSGVITSHVAGADLQTQLALTTLDPNATNVFDANGLTITGSSGDSIRFEIDGFRYYEELTGAYDHQAIFNGSISSMTFKDSSGVDLITISGGEVDAFEMVNALEMDALASISTGTVSLTNMLSIFSQFAIDWTGSSGDDVIGGFGFNDTLRGGAGSDYIETNGGDDIIEGGTGIDFVVLGSITSIDPATGFVTFDSTDDGSNTIRIGLDGTDADLDAVLGFDVTAVGAAGGDVIQLMLPSANAGPISVGFTQITVTDLDGDFATVQAEIAVALGGIDPADLIDDMVEVLLVADATSTAVIELDMSSGSAVVTAHAVLEGVSDFAALSDGSHIIVTNPVV